MIFSKKYKNFYLIILSTLLGSASSYYLSKYSLLPPSAASATSALLFCLLTGGLKIKNTQLEGAFYMGSFIGMGKNELIVWIAPFVGGTLFYVFKKPFSGFGGKLGATAFVSSLFVLLFLEILSW